MFAHFNREDPLLLESQLRGSSAGSVTPRIQMTFRTKDGWRARHTWLERHQR